MKRSPLINTWGQSRKALLYMRWAVQNLGPFHSVLDIGAGDGIVAEALPPDVTYPGIDIGADIYQRTDRVTYIDNFAELRSSIAALPAVDLVTIFDVLEHTAEFAPLFHDAVNSSRRYGFVSLPTELNIIDDDRGMRAQAPDRGCANRHTAAYPYRVVPPAGQLPAQSAGNGAP